MVAIGRALMGRPKALLLDEPSLGLAPLVVKQMFEIIQKINQTGVTVLLAEQNAYSALRSAPGLCARTVASSWKVTRRDAARRRHPQSPIGA